MVVIVVECMCIECMFIERMCLTYSNRHLPLVPTFKVHG